MSQADVEMLRRGFEAFAREGIAGIVDLATDDFELVWTVFELRDGKAARLTIHTDKDEALAAIDQTRRQ